MTTPNLQAVTLLINWKGTYNGASSYLVNDGVIFTPGGGSAGQYVCISPAAPGVDPTNTSSWLYIGPAATGSGGGWVGSYPIVAADIATGAVTSAKILDGTIVDADVNASAAIAESKIANLTSDLAGRATKPSAPIYFIDYAFGSDANDGKSWGSAFKTLAAAITAAGSSPAAFYMAPGAHTAVVDTLALNVVGHALHGPGRSLCALGITGTGTYGLKISQAQCVAEGLSVNPSSTVTYPVGVTVNPSSTEMTTFRDIITNGGVNGFGIGADTALDVAETSLFGCFAFGYSRAGYQIGNGTPANVLNTRMYGCTAEAGGQYGVRVDGSGVEFYGGTLQGNSVADVFIGSNLSSAPVIVDGVRSEGSARLWESGFFGQGGTPMAIRNALFSGGSMNADGKWIKDDQDGPFLVENATCISAAHGPLIEVASGGAARAITLKNVTQAAPLSSGINTNSPTRITVISYTDTTGGGQVVTPFAYFDSSTTAKFKIDSAGVATVPDPTTGTQIANKEYVDAAIATGGASAVDAGPRPIMR